MFLMIKPRSRGGEKVPRWPTKPTPSRTPSWEGVRLGGRFGPTCKPVSDYLTTWIINLFHSPQIFDFTQDEPLAYALGVMKVHQKGMRFLGKSLISEPGHRMGTRRPFFASGSTSPSTAVCWFTRSNFVVENQIVLELTALTGLGKGHLPQAKNYTLSYDLPGGCG